ncbi:MAG: CDP-diacylglycerol--glycerol-3-phosphate 3-phosphatidyltransferase [Phycisphaerae bacterium]|nr:CDP-diacylglycerol--glycerol-3-phosphate 3-phosphatidyltransferase [Phycisphaerae bacterium]
MNLPNQITLVRLLLTIVFCALLSEFDVRERERGGWLLDVGLALFIVAGVSDIIDGYLARRRNQVTLLGRILDPFVDKVLVCGAFVLLLGPNFVEPATGRNVTGLSAWMVVVILARELLVSGLRGFSEASGQVYAANIVGKAKMAVQSVTIGWILVSLTHGRSWEPWIIGRTVLIWATVLITTASIFAYLSGARSMLRASAAA